MTENKAAATSGRFVWHELYAKNTEAAKGFYGELFGWKTRETDMGPGGKYNIISANGQDLGGLLQAEGDAPSHWLAYCTVHDVDAAVSRAKAQGASVHVPPTNIPGVGRFAIIADKQGAQIAPMKMETERPESDGPPPLHTFCWNELVTQDADAAVALYKDTFEWATEDKDMGPMGVYRILKRNEKQAGGIMKAFDPKVPSSWLGYVFVDEVDASFKRAEKLGGKGLMPPADIPGIGRFAVVSDPTGATIALFK